MGSSGVLVGGRGLPFNVAVAHDRQPRRLASVSAGVNSNKQCISNSNKQYIYIYDCWNVSYYLLPMLATLLECLMRIVFAQP